MKILLLEDDMILSEIIEEFLLTLGYEVVCCYDMMEAEDQVYSTGFDLFLLDVNVPGGSGFELLESLRQIGNKTPAILITSLHELKDMQKGFEKGCDDYIKKPFELQELKLRIDNIKRLYGIESTSVYRITDTVSFDSMNSSVLKGDQLIQIPKKEGLVLLYFLNNKNKTISTEELGVNVWDYENRPSDATIRTYIKNIRKLIGSEVLTNLKGVGYRFNAE